MDLGIRNTLKIIITFCLLLAGCRPYESINTCSIDKRYSVELVGRIHGKGFLMFERVDDSLESFDFFVSISPYNAADATYELRGYGKCIGGIFKGDIYEERSLSKVSELVGGEFSGVFGVPGILFPYGQWRIYVSRPMNSDVEEYMGFWSVRKVFEDR